MVSRSFAQTGTPPTTGRVVRRTLPSSLGSPIPTRSGRQQRRRGLLWKVFGIFAGLMVIALATVFAFSSNAFRIEQVNVIGTHSGTLVNSIQRIGVKGQNIFLVNIEGLAERIKQFPPVADVSLSKQWPNQLTITLVERSPLLLWQTHQGTYSVDQQGVVIAMASETPQADRLQMVIDQGKHTGGPSIHAGSRLNQADIMFAAEIFKRLPQISNIGTLKLNYDGTIYANSSDSRTQESKGAFTIESSEGWIAYLGSANDTNPLDNRFIELQHILALAQKQQLELATIDLRYGMHVVYTLKA